MVCSRSLSFLPVLLPCTRIHENEKYYNQAKGRHYITPSFQGEATREQYTYTIISESELARQLENIEVHSSVGSDAPHNHQPHSLTPIVKTSTGLPSELMAEPSQAPCAQGVIPTASAVQIDESRPDDDGHQEIQGVNQEMGGSQQVASSEMEV